MRDDRTPVLGEATPATIPDLVLANAVNRSADPAVTWMSGGTVSTMSWSMYRDRIINVALAFLQLDVGPGRDVAVLTGNNVEHLIASMAAAHCGAAAVSIYETLSDEQLAHVLDDCRPTVLIVADDEAARRARRLANCRDCVGAIVTLDGSGALGWPELGLLGTRVTAKWMTALEERMAHLDRSDPLTYVYTSGTTGASKGVILTTDNLLDEVASVTRSGLLDREYCSISYLPMAHVVERLWSLYVPAYLGGHVVCCPDAADLPAYLARFRPSIFFGVPRIFEKLARLAEATMAVQFSDVGPILKSERTLLTRISRQRRDGGSIPAELASAETIAREGEVRRVRTRLGLDRAIVGCGAAAMSEDLHDLWASLGIDVLLGYGLTETAGIAVSDRPGLGVSGAVGLPMPGWEARIAEDGEILLRGPGNTTGYRNRPDATDELYAPQGWLRTGDLGALDNAGRLHVTGRKKDILVTAAGKNITPTVIESRLSGQSFLDDAMVLAEGRPYVVALLTVDPEALRQFATGHNITTENLDELVQHPVVLARVDELVAGANARLSRPEQIKKYTVLSETWTPQTGQLTATMKLRRNVIERAYHDLVAALYGDPPHRQGSEQ